MFEILVIFSVAVAGSLARRLADLTVNVAAPELSETITAGFGGGFSPSPNHHEDPVLRVGLLLAYDGAIVLALVSALPGALALERTGLAFLILCVGGLFGEMAATESVPLAVSREPGQGRPAAHGRTSRLLAVALTLMLNLSFAVSIAGQGLIRIVPPELMNVDRGKQLEPVVVVARRPRDALDGDASSYR